MTDWVTYAWIGLGFFGQGLFFMRFVLQWIMSERKGEVTFPVYFWYFSIGGGFILFIYAVHQHDIVFTIGQGLGILIYWRNMVLAHRHAGKKSPQ